MKTTILVAALFVALPLVALAPTADAVGICSQYKDDFCKGYVICVGYRWGYPSYFECTGPGVRDPCSYHCWLP